MYHSTPRVMVPRVLDKAIRFGLCAAAPKRDYCLKRVQFQRCVRKHEGGGPEAYTGTPRHLASHLSRPCWLQRAGCLCSERTWQPTKPRYETEHL